MMSDFQTSFTNVVTVPSLKSDCCGKLSPRFHILFDIDGTLTDDLHGLQIDGRYVLGNALIEIFCDLLQETGMGRDAAARMLVDYAGKNVYWDYADFIHHFQLPAQKSWQRLRQWHSDHIRIYEDGVQLVRRLFGSGHTLHIVSNNPLSGCLLKLEAAGLGGLQGTPWFSRIFCSNIHRGQKGNAGFWERAIISAGITAEQAVVIGNDYHEDFEVPRQIGVRRHFIVDRGGALQASADGPVIVRDLYQVEAHMRDARPGRERVRTAHASM